MNSIKGIIFFGFTLRLFVAIWNGFFGPSLGAEQDAVNFHMEAVQFAITDNIFFGEFRIGWIYTQFLGIFYKILTPSIFIGSLLSCIFWYISARILENSAIKLSINKSNRYWIIFIYSLLPSSILLTSVTLREVYQLLFVNIAIISILNVHLEKKSSSWIMLFLSVAGFGSLHGALLGFGLILITEILFLNAIYIKNRISIKRLTITSITFFIVLFSGISLYGGLDNLTATGLASAVETYQTGVLEMDGRTNYRTEVNISSLIDLFLFIPIALFQYLFEPLPWKISGIGDAVQLFENLLRAYLIYKISKNIFFKKKYATDINFTIHFIFNT